MNFKKGVTALALAALVVASPTAFAKPHGKGKKAKHGKKAAVQDVNRDRSISRDEWRGDLAQFERRDLNRDGVLSQADRELRRQRSEQEFRSLDANRDGVISQSEWRGDSATFERRDRNRDGVITSADRQRARRTTEAQRFRGMDTNRDGLVSRQEWRGNDESFRRLDRNRDGVISQDERPTR